MKHVRIAFFIFCGLCLLCCKKKTLNGTVILTVTDSNNKVVPNATVYLKKGTKTEPPVPFSQYDKNAKSNSSGLVFFEDLTTDSYFFYATTDLPTGTATGTLTLAIESRKAMNRVDGGNRYERKIPVN